MTTIPAVPFDETALVTEYMVPAPSSSCAAPVIKYVAPAPDLTYAAPTLDLTNVAPVAPTTVTEYFAPARVAPSLQSASNLHDSGLVNPQFSSTCVEVSGSLPFAPVSQTYPEQIVAGGDGTDHREISTLWQETGESTRNTRGTSH